VGGHACAPPVPVPVLVPDVDVPLAVVAPPLPVVPLPVVPLPFVPLPLVPVAPPLPVVVCTLEPHAKAARGRRTQGRMRKKERIMGHLEAKEASPPRARSSPARGATATR
jgi:hypothetical protein